MPVAEATRRQFDAAGRPRTALGQLMQHLGVASLADLSPMIRPEVNGRPRSPSWVGVYRELVEWAVLFAIIRNKDFGTDTILVVDGLLRSQVFAGSLFRRYLAGLHAGILKHERQSRRRIFLAGVAKKSKVLDRYRLAMALEGILTTDYPAYVEAPHAIEDRAYVWSAFARRDDWVQEREGVNRFVGGKMFFVKFGNRPRDPIWPVDIFLPQEAHAPAILGSMLADALDGFPVTATRLRSEGGIPWRGLMAAIEKHLPETLDGRQDFAYQLVPKALTRLYGPRGWETFKSDRGTTYVRVLN